MKSEKLMSEARPTREDETRVINTARTEIINNVPSLTGGINLERARTFIEGFGLIPRDVILVEVEKENEVLSHIKSVMNRHGVTLFEKKTKEGGLYINQINLAVIFRNRQLESLFSSFISEVLVIHELAHGTEQIGKVQDFSVLTDNQVKLSTAKSGFAETLAVSNQGEISEPLKGYFFEEAFAELLAGEYRKKFLPLKDRKNLFQLTRENNLYQDNITRPTLSSLVKVKDIYGNLETSLPLKYVTVNKFGQTFRRSSAFAAFGLELLLKKIPSLRQKLVDARRSQEGISKFEQAIEKKMPGLFEQLAVLQYNASDFIKGLQLINES